jgi:hypothetical protein
MKTPMSYVVLWRFNKDDKWDIADELYSNIVRARAWITEDYWVNGFNPDVEYTICPIAIGKIVTPLKNKKRVQ